MNRALTASLLTIVLVAVRAWAEPPAEIDYQGQISVGRRPFSGTGYFKYAITDAFALTNLWANDGSAAGEPAASCELPVRDGRFSTLLGAAPMHAIDPAALAADGECFFRVWFSQEGSVFRELTPRQKIVSSPFAINALRLDGKSREFFEDAARLSSGTLADGRLGAAVTRLGASIGPGEIEANAVGSREIGSASVKLENMDLADTDTRYVRKIEGVVQGPLHVAGPARFEDGIAFLRACGDLSMGIYTNMP